MYEWLPAFINQEIPKYQGKLFSVCKICLCCISSQRKFDAMLSLLYSEKGCENRHFLCLTWHLLVFYIKLAENEQNTPVHPYSDNVAKYERPKYFGEGRIECEQCSCSL